MIFVVFVPPLLSWVDIVIVGTRKRVKKLRDLADTVFKDVDDKTVGM